MSMHDVDGMNSSVMTGSTRRDSVFFENSSTNINQSGFLGTDTSLGVSVIRKRIEMMAQSENKPKGGSLMDTLSQLSKMQEDSTEAQET